MGIEISSLEKLARRAQSACSRAENVERRLMAADTGAILQALDHAASIDSRLYSAILRAEGLMAEVKRTEETIRGAQEAAATASGYALAAQGYLEDAEAAARLAQSYAARADTETLADAARRAIRASYDNAANARHILEDALDRIGHDT